MMDGLEEYNNTNTMIWEIGSGLISVVQAEEVRRRRRPTDLMEITDV